MKLKYTFESVEMGDEYIYVPVDMANNQMHGVIKLNKSGLEIAELLKEQTTEEGIIEALAAKYDNSREALTSYVQKVLNVFRDAGAIED